MIHSVGIIGFGRFGRVLYNILRKGFAIKVYDLSINHEDALNQEFAEVDFVDWEVILQEEVIFIAVPINRFEEVVQKMAPSLNHHQTVIDVCSVKVHPTQVMLNHLSAGVGIIATHPLFGPDSYGGYRDQRGRKIMMHMERPCSNDKDRRQYHTWKDFFSKQGLEVVEMSPEEHDRMAAETQGLTHYLGRCLKEYGIKKTPIDTQGFTDLLDLVEQTCNDTWELYQDLQRFNPFTQEMINKIDHSIKKLNQKTKLSYHVPQ